MTKVFFKLFLKNSVQYSIIAVNKENLFLYFRKKGGGTVKEIYERADLEVIKFHTGDVITTSIPYEDDETSRIK